MTADHHLLVDGEKVTLVGTRQFLVKSKSQSGHHAVEYDDTEKGWRCSCVGFQVRKSCRHAAAIVRLSRDEARISLAGE